MRYFWFFYFISLAAHSNKAFLSITESDPSSLVEGVSVIKGDLYSYEEDYIVQGAEPIRLPHSFVSGDRIRTFNYLRAIWLGFMGRVNANEPNGTTLFYYKENTDKSRKYTADDFRLTQVVRYSEDEKNENSDRFVWNQTNLKCKSLLDANGNPIWARTHLYDDWGNVKEEVFYGNLSGKGIELSIRSNGLPEKNGAEYFTKKMAYSKDGRHLLLKQDEGELSVLYKYRQDAQLIESKSICPGTEEEILYTYEYNKDLLLTRESIRDQISSTAKIITPGENSPYIGMPDSIKEVYYDDNGREVLLKKTVFQYGPGALVIEKDTYYADDILRYSLNMTYDEKGRLTSETNPMGLQAIYRYDEVGNLFIKSIFTIQESKFEGYLIV
jgi:hypothetical protein